MIPNAECYGRRAEREVLREYVRRATAGNQQLVFLEGEAGLGKTALLTAFAVELVKNRGARTFYLSAPEGETYQPVHHAVLAATNQRLYRRVGGSQATEVVRSVYVDWLSAIPVIGNFAAAVVATIRHSRNRKPKGFLPTGGSVDEDIEALLAAARRKPLVLLVDDLEKADTNEVARLEKLISVADSNARILIVGAYRPSAPGGIQPPVMRLLTTLPTADETFARLRLGALSLDDLKEWIEGRFPGAEPPHTFLERLHDSTGGHPGAISEALANLQFRKGVRRTVTGLHFEADIAMPPLAGGAAPSVDLEAIPADIAEVVRAASVLGVEFDGTSLARLMKADELEVEDRLAGAVHYGVLESSGEAVLANGDIASRFRFKSPHIVPILRGAIPPGELAVMVAERDLGEPR